MSISKFARAASGSLLRNLWNRDRAAVRRRRNRRVGFAPAIDQLESRVALAITTPLSIGGATIGSFLDAPTGPGNVSDFVTVSIEGTKGTVVFNGGKGVADGTNIQTIEILDASPDFQVTFGATVGTANAVPYGSDGIIQLGTITTGNVIRGINTVRGPLTNTAPTTGVASPIGFTQNSPGTGTLLLEGDQSSTFPVGAYVCATPLLSNTTVGAPSFGTVTTSQFFAGTNTTLIMFDDVTAAGTTAGALTLAERVQPYFELTTFVGVNFSNRTLKDGGGIFVDRVVGADATVNEVDYADLGILLSQGLLAYSTIGIRDELDAGIILGTTSTASADGRLLIESATEFVGGNGGRIFVGPQNAPTAKNSKLQLTVGQGGFGAAVTVLQNFDGVMNIGSSATGPISFQRNVGPLAVLNANSWDTVGVNGNFAGRINSNGSSLNLDVSGNVASTARVNSDGAVTLSVIGSVLKGAVISSDSQSTLTVGRNFSGIFNNGSGTLTGTVGGNVTGGTLASSGGVSLAVTGNVVNSRLIADDTSTIAVQGGLTNSAVEVTSGLTLTVGRAVTGSSILTDRDMSVGVIGNVAKSRLVSTTGNVTVNVGGSLTDSTLISSDDGVSLFVARDALRVQVISDDQSITMGVGGNFSGKVQSASGDLFVGIGGSVLKGSTFLTGDNAAIEVDGNFDGAVVADDLRFLVGGNVSQASRIVADRVTNWQSAIGPNFGIGGRFDGIVNVGVFDAAVNNTTVTILGNGAGSSARFNVGRFETDTLVFNGNFLGNMRVGQDLVANLEFNGNVHRITIGGRVGSYVPGNTITTTPASIAVTGRLLYLNTNSYFQAITPGQSGVFWNDATSVSPSLLTVTGSLVTGSYVTVVPNRQTVAPPLAPPAQQYSVPGTLGSFNASLTGDPDTPPNTPYGISVTFAAPTSSLSGPGDGNLPVLYYEYTTNANLGAGATWSRFSNAGQQPSLTGIALPGPSTGGSFAQFLPVTYFVSVRAVNAMGAGVGTGSTSITVPATTP